MTSWKLVELGSYERPLSAQERGIWLLGISMWEHQRDDLHMAVSVTLEVRNFIQLPRSSINALRRAWQRLRFEQPIIAASTNAEGTSMSYTVDLTFPGVERWTDATFVVAGATDSVATKDFIRKLEPVGLMQCIVIPHRNWVLLRTSNCSTDERDILVLLDRLFQLAGSHVDPRNLKWGDEIRRLLPAQENTSEIPEHADDNYIRTRLHESHEFDFIMNTTYLDEAAPNGRNRYVQVSLLASETNDLIDACKKRGVSVTAAVHAALGILSPDASKQPQSCRGSSRVDRRQLRSDKMDGDSLGAEAYHFAVASVASSVAPSNRSTDVIHTDYFHTDYFHADYFHTLDIAYGPFDYLHEHLMTPEIPGEADRASMVDLCIIGDVDKMIQKEYVFTTSPNQAIGDFLWDSDVDVPPVVVLGDFVQIVNMDITPAMLTSRRSLFCWIFRGQMRLSICYNDAHHSDEQVIDMGSLFKSKILNHALVDGGSRK